MVPLLTLISQHPAEDGNIQTQSQARPLARYQVREHLRHAQRPIQMPPQPIEGGLHLTLIILLLVGEDTLQTLTSLRLTGESPRQIQTIPLVEEDPLQIQTHLLDGESLHPTLINPLVGESGILIQIILHRDYLAVTVQIQIRPPHEGELAKLSAAPHVTTTIPVLYQKRDGLKGTVQIQIYRPLGLVAIPRQSDDLNLTAGEGGKRHWVVQKRACLLLKTCAEKLGTCVTKRIKCSDSWITLYLGRMPRQLYEIDQLEGAEI